MNNVFEKVIKINDIVKTNNIITGISYEIIMCFISDKTNIFYNSNDYKPMLGDNLYFSKDCSVPRFKLKSFCEKHQVKITTNNDKANIVFISEKFIDEYTDSDWGSTTDYTDFITFANLVFPKNKAILTFINQTSNLNLDNVSSSVTTKIKFNSYRIKNSFANTKNINLKASINHHDKYCSIDNYDTVNKMLNGKKVYNQNNILRLINDSVILNKDSYDELNKILDSNDDHNIKLAMELIANCDYEKSAVYILLLFKSYGEKMWNSGNRAHVNFKALTSFFNLSSKYDMSRLCLDDLIVCLKERNLLSEENKSILMPIAFEEMQNNNRFDHFKITDIKFDNNDTVIDDENDNEEEKEDEDEEHLEMNETDEDN